MKVELTAEQRALRKVIEQNLEVARRFSEGNSDLIQEAMTRMNEASHQLHIQLDPKPKHHQHIIENRGLDPEDTNFYYHIHTVEDLLAYLDDDSANNDPEDVTIGDKFGFRIYSRRWGHEDTYSLTRTENGWYSEFNSYSGEDTFQEIGMSNLYAIFKQDSISFPAGVDSYLSSIWERAKIEGLSHQQVQELLNRVANWISETEQNAPSDILL